MSAIDLFLLQYGLLAIFLILLLKSSGVPIPIPADLIILATAARVGQGKFVWWQAVAIILLALVLGGLTQFWLARGPGRRILYRFGRYLGLTPARLDAAATKIKLGGPLGITTAILVPGVRGVAVVAAGLAGMSLRTFLVGLVLGSTAFLGIHFFLGYLAGSLFTVIGRVVPVPAVVTIVVILFVVVFALWVGDCLAQAESEAPGAGCCFAGGMA